MRTYRVEAREPDTGAGHALVLTASLGPGITGVEVSVGLDLRLPEVDIDNVFGRSDHLVGQLVSPETAPATKDTVQVDLTERLPKGEATFGLVKLRGKILWQAGGHHVLRFTRQMPTGWPGGNHHEADESAISGRTAPLGGGAKLYLGVPMLTADRVQVLGFDVGGLERVVAWTQDVSRRTHGRAASALRASGGRTRPCPMDPRRVRSGPTSCPCSAYHSRSPCTLPHTARSALGRAAHSADTVSMPARCSRARTRAPTPGRSSRSRLSSRPGSALSTVSPSGLSIAEATFASHRLDATPIEHVTRGPTAARSRALMRRPTSSGPSRAPSTQHSSSTEHTASIGSSAFTACAIRRCTRT